MVILKARLPLVDRPDLCTAIQYLEVRNRLVSHLLIIAHLRGRPPRTVGAYLYTPQRVFERVTDSFLSRRLTVLNLFQKRENAKVKVFDAKGKGMGLKLLAPVKKGDFIMEYVGEVRRGEFCRGTVRWAVRDAFLGEVCCSSCFEAR